MEEYGTIRIKLDELIEKSGISKNKLSHKAEIQRTQLNNYCNNDVVINKGPDRDIDRDAVNMLITFLLDGEYQMIVVDKLTDLTSDLSDRRSF